MVGRLKTLRATCFYRGEEMLITIAVRGLLGIERDVCYYLLTCKMYTSRLASTINSPSSNALLRITELNISNILGLSGESIYLLYAARTSIFFSYST